jgi:hypothetical protein
MTHLPDGRQGFSQKTAISVQSVAKTLLLPNTDKQELKCLKRKKNWLK